jgi:hypothetical protein
MARKKHSDPHARQAKASRKQVGEAREQLAAGGLSHQERRRLRSQIGERDAAARLRQGEFRHIVIVAAGAVAAMAVVAAAVGLVSAIEAADGHGTAGTFTVGSQLCLRRQCPWVGSFRSLDGETQPHVVYSGNLPADAGPGTSLPVVEPGGSDFVYARHDSAAWVTDVFWMVLVGGVVGLLLWIMPLGLGGRDTAGAVV